jgi:hypothetical protein
LDEHFIAFPKICENALLAVHFIKIFNLKVEAKSGFKIVKIKNEELNPGLKSTDPNFIEARYGNPTHPPPP